MSVCASGPYLLKALNLHIRSLSGFSFSLIHDGAYNTTCLERNPFFLILLQHKAEVETSVLRSQNGKFRVSLKNICPCAQGCAAPEQGDRGQPACGCQLHDCSVSRSCSTLPGEQKSILMFMAPAGSQGVKKNIFSSICPTGTNDKVLFFHYSGSDVQIFKQFLSNLQIVFKRDILRAL